ncbi:MAG: endolytic transglycosylase MltG [Prevotellaceae bacterium]|jgi:UPF0755 protein|nr:endolytic transglycosylase MltG [Prevotellaceae bacterium]
MKLFENKKLIKISASIIILIILFAAYIFVFPNINVKSKKDTFIVVNETDNYDSIVVKLQQKNLLRDKIAFNIVAKMLDYPDNVKSGCYLLKHNMSNLQLIYRLKKSRQTPVKLTFNNLRTKADLAGRIAEQLEMDSLALLDLLNNDSILCEYGFTREDVPAMFIPNTYEVYWNISPTRLFEKMYDEYEHFWNDSRCEKAAEIGLTPAEIVTLASIVEEESNKRVEKPIIAGLYINRLHKNMPLQADPTVKFALGNFTLKRVYNVKSVDSPYNTYLHTGLPPGPIRVPSIETIDAVLNYDRNDYLFMCAKSDFSGKHAFTGNLAEHERNRAKYIKALNERGIGVKKDTVPPDTLMEK